jgi:hypothetical protein
MKVRLLVFFCGLVSVLLGSSARADDSTSIDHDNLAGWNATGNALVAACQGQGENYSQCLSFMHGALDSQYLESPKGHELCIPEGVTNGQLVKVVLKYADEHPENLQFPAAAFVLLGVRRAWGREGPQGSCKAKR